MLTLRLHIDDCPADNGALRVAPGSHLQGFLDVHRAMEYRQSNGEVICTAARGDALLMRPLILHASSPAASATHRRVIHLEFAADRLTGGLQWVE